MLGNILALAAATLLLVAIPGPNVALIIANSIRHGALFGIITVLGTTIGVALQLILTLSGFVALLHVAADILTWVKWVGVFYLLYLGIRAWNTPADDLGNVKARTERASTLFWRGLILATVNPKTLIFNAAFLPQFMDRSAPPVSQMIILGTTFLIVLAAGDTIWAITAGSARSVLQKYGRLRNKITGGFLLASCVGLAAARR